MIRSLLHDWQCGALSYIGNRNPETICFKPKRWSMIQNSFMSRANSIVIPGGKLDLAMQLILTPLILQLVDRKNRAS